MHRHVLMYVAATALLLFTVAPLTAEDGADQPEPGAASLHDHQDAAQPQESAGGCAAKGKCCGSAACSEAKKRSMKEGKAAIADCPCKRNRMKPNRAP